MRGSLRRKAELAVSMILALTAVQMGAMTPAHAASPVVLSFLPPSGPAGTSVTITGTGFQDASAATGVTFNGTAASFSVDSGTQITASVPVGATTGPIAVTDGEGTGSGLVDFTVTPPPAPTIGSFLPTSGPVGTPVTIAGTGFTGASTVTFAGVSTTFDVVSDLEIDTVVPDDATTGPIAVTTAGGVATSVLDFTVTAPASHRRSVGLRLRRHLRATGNVHARDGFGLCEANAIVLIQRRHHGRWRTVKHDLTNLNGSYRTPLPDRGGSYRALVVRTIVNSGQDVCRRAMSRVRRTH